ncbi:hypothetical protein PMAYCL1PPCAC_17145 [Pristionchus mayeri]|uniref:Uncharacterized protein n=1 Tax=Pristionchus mayeri TaxID=1317129 RepID=A0AAN5I057_9BILA|nr:hypothetical protein PMAYCL1PPCAC_17145 [Pristionchus mayeri]
MFTHRVCCCSATVASQVMACIAMIMCAIVAISNWLVNESLWLQIYQTVLLVTEIFACVLVFVACCKIRPAFVLPIIVIQIWNTVSIIGAGIWTVSVRCLGGRRRHRVLHLLLRLLPSHFTIRFALSRLLLQTSHLHESIFPPPLRPRPLQYLSRESRLNKKASTTSLY